MTNTLKTLATALLALALTAPVQAQSGGLSVELNRMDATDGGCSVYFVLENGTGRSFEDLSLDLVMFDTEGVVASRLAVQFAPLPSGKTALRVFDVPNLACGDMGRMLLNDAVGCRDAEGREGGCLAAVATASRTEVEFIK